MGMRFCLMAGLVLAALPFKPLMAETVAASEDGTVYVQTQGAALFEDPSFGGDPVARLAQGLEVRVLAEEDGWQRIRVEELEGWMPAMVLRDTPPTGRESHVDEAAELESSARRRASAVTTAGAIRGVEEDERLLDDPNLNIEALRRMEELGASPEEALQFMSEEEEER
ncbi:hypothetical protein J2T60_001822 [Natronospira proteinivora]|uniref:SH3 domain-containing protein n=1 Tax=Natronospira proteinivora TaxID=1807133 RepID=A0ABT1GD02_9GAMM|nr:hypothetical protein [Natronospira proteinivora]MCP1727822.1 hypothetical protein [Natronospira proteinivora]